MQRFSSRIALLTVVGLLSAVPPVFAAPNNNGNNAPNNASSGPIDCTLPVNKNNPFCLQQLNGNSNKGPGSTNMGSPKGGPNSNNNGGQGQGNTNQGSGPPSNSGGPKPGTFNFNQHDRSQFHQRFHGFNFGNFSFFLTPSFSITINTSVPTSYHRHLKTVPSSIYRYYPWFRGYLYFVDHGGDFVIVNPHSFKIVAVL
jgi:hypothetical protein